MSTRLEELRQLPVWNSISEEDKRALERYAELSEEDLHCQKVIDRLIVILKSGVEFDLFHGAPRYQHDA